jgi:hypothetical protein
VSDSDLLRCRYRRLLWAYPNWYRRERGQEILTTLLDAARPGQHHPSRRDVFDILARAALCRLRPPRGAACWIATVSVALLAAAAAVAGVPNGVLAAAFASAPSEQQAIAIAQVAMAEPPHNLPGPTFRCPDYCNHQWRSGGDHVVVFDDTPHRNTGVDHTSVVYWTWTTPTDVIDAARGRLIAEGWTVDERQYPAGSITSGPQGPPSDGFTAYRGHLALHVHRSSYPPLMLTLEPRLPSSFAFEGGALAGGAAGLAGGWLLIVWVQHRYRRHGPTLRGLMKLFGLLPVWVIGAATAVGLALAAPDVTSWSVLSAAAAFRMFGVYGAAMIALGLAVSAALAVLLAALPMPATGPTTGRGPLPVSLTP